LLLQFQDIAFSIHQLEAALFHQEFLQPQIEQFCIHQQAIHLVLAICFLTPDFQSIKT